MCVYIFVSRLTNSFTFFQPAGDNLSISYENPRLIHQQYHHHHQHQVTPTSFFPNDKTSMLVAPVSGGGNSGGAGHQLRVDWSSGYGSPDSTDHI
jgi:hypothetical protein